MLKNLFALCCFFLLLVACEESKQIQPLPVINEIKVNQRFSVILPENHQTGYTWVMKDQFDKNLVDHINTVWHGNDKGVYFNFKALKPGECELDFICRKYTDTSDNNHFRVKISP